MQVVSSTSITSGAASETQPQQQRPAAPTPRLAAEPFAATPERSDARTQFGGILETPEPQWHSASMQHPVQPISLDTQMGHQAPYGQQAVNSAMGSINPWMLAYMAQQLGISLPQPTLPPPLPQMTQPYQDMSQYGYSAYPNAAAQYPLAPSLSPWTYPNNGVPPLVPSQMQMPMPQPLPQPQAGPIQAWALESKLKADQVLAQQEAWAENMRRSYGGASDCAAQLCQSTMPPVAPPAMAPTVTKENTPPYREGPSPFDRLVSLVQSSEYHEGSPEARHDRLSEIDSTPNVRQPIQGDRFSTPLKAGPKERQYRGKNDYENWPPHGQASYRSPGKDYDYTVEARHTTSPPQRGTWRETRRTPTRWN